MPAMSLKKKPSYTQSRVYIGIDPGQAGAIVVLYQDEVDHLLLSNSLTEIWHCLQEAKRMADLKELGTQGVQCVLEHVWARPGQSAPGMWKFAKGVGALEMGLVAAKIPHVMCTPQKWLNALSIPTRKKNETDSQWKQRLKTKAEQLFPHVKVTLATADALLIAYYCRSKWENTL